MKDESSDESAAPPVEHAKGEPVRAKSSESARSFCVLLAEDNGFVSELFRYAVVRFQRELVGYESHDLLTAVTGQEALR
ncbi:MAG TPA: hypothetical protein VFZ61_02770, partial [Polyangiales bacterium]